MPVGTRGAVKALDSADLESLDARIVLANAFHLLLRPGADVVAALGGIHRFCGWDGHVLTDSGGFQVHSLGPQVDDDGVTFSSVYDGSSVRLTPETAVEVQGLIGADIQMVLDVCVTLPAGRDELRRAVERTADWAERARRRHQELDARPEGQAIFGIVQGGTEADLRAESAARTVALDFDGYAVGGLSVGEPRPAMLEALAATVPHLPETQPRYLMGVGDPVGLVEAVALGVDQFDCVAPTRMARHGSVLTGAGRLNLRNAVNSADAGPLDGTCPCPTCQRYSTGLPPAPAVGGGADGLAAAEHPQPHLRARLHGRGSRRHRGRDPLPPAATHCRGVGGRGPRAAVRTGLGYHRTAVRTSIPFSHLR